MFNVMIFCGCLGLDSRWATAIELEGQLNCLAGNATCSHLVVGGRNGMYIHNLLYSHVDLWLNG